MKVTVINSSPRRKCGNTSLILAPFLEGLKEQGVDVKLFYTKTLKINPCQGEYSCWYKHPGKCYQNDDMEKVLNRLRESEIWVFASPIYAVGMTGPLKTILDRILPLSKPFVTVRDGQCRLIFYDDLKVKKIVLVSSCGFWNLENFDSILEEVESFSRKIDVDFAGKLLRPSGDYFRTSLKSGEKFDDILEACKGAAFELLENGRIDSDTELTVSRPIQSLDESVSVINSYARNQWDSLGKE